MAEQTFPSKTIAPLLELADTIYANASILTHYNLGDVEALATVSEGDIHATKETRPKRPPAKEVIDATSCLLEAASDISILAAGPTNYLRNLSLSVSPRRFLHNYLQFISPAYSQ